MQGRDGENMLMITLKTLTPLWTGDANRECRELKESGILGSLRWWAEVVLVALGAKVCDPLETKCQDRKHCSACHLFGCTGWRKRFRLDFRGEITSTGHVLPLRSKYPWSIYPGLTSPSLEVACTPLTPDKTEAADNLLILRLLFTLIARHGGLGARQSQGFGTIQLISGELQSEEIDKAIETLCGLKDKRNDPPQGRGDGFPDLREMFFWKACLNTPPAATGQPSGAKEGKSALRSFASLAGSLQPQSGTQQPGKQDIAAAVRSYSTTVPGAKPVDILVQYSGKENFVPTAFAAREAIRGWFRGTGPKDRLNKIRHFYCGQVGGNDTTGAKILVSHVYLNPSSQWEFRVWGWLPDHKTEEVDVKGSSVGSHLQKQLNDPNWLIHRTPKESLFQGFSLTPSLFLTINSGESGEAFLRRLLA
jgi:hypothetical protein